MKEAQRLWPAYAAASWSLVFGVFHAIWAMGFYIGLDAEAAKAFQTTWKLVFDVVIVGVCVLGVLLALAFVQPWGRRLPQRGVNFVGWCAVGLLLLRSVGSVVQMIYFVITGRSAQILHDPMALWELWFYLGAALFFVSFQQFKRNIRS
ncbi:MAG TPA: DUF3995 domain-containing protein [Candidatus Angelobacter sp.]|nr:DUF3995 domain-containing protein [Candidatus Angelobacter sp.]